MIGILPGSRKNEVKYLLPIMLKCFENIDLDNITLIVFLAETLNPNSITPMLDKCSFKHKIKIVSGTNYNIRQKVKFSLVSSGTATVENLILNVPMIIFYKINFFVYYIAKYLVHVKFIGMPNILAGKLIVPEYIQNIPVREIRRKIKEWLKPEEKLDEIKIELTKTKKLLQQNKKPLQTAVEIIQQYIF